MYRWLLAVLATSAVGLAFAEICDREVCEFYFDIEHRRTMTYNKGVVNTFNAELDGSRVVLSPDPHLRPLPTNADVTDDVITADGVRRNIITVNRMFPGPTMEVIEGSQVVVHVTNHLLSQAITIHWHGILQQSTPWMDGVAYVSQCPLAPRQSFTYRFIATPAGTHWYHDHIVAQRSDGLMGMLIVHKRPPPKPEVNLMLMDWFHYDSTTAEVTNFYGNIGGAGDYMHPGQLRDYSHDGVELSALKYASGLINGRGRFGGNLAPLTTMVVPTRETTRFRMCNSGSEFYFDVSVDGHSLRVVALDGNDVDPIAVDSFILAPGERVDFEVESDQEVGNYWMRCRTLKSGVSPDVIPDGTVQEVLAVLSYEGSTQGDPTTDQRNCTASEPCKVFNCPFAGFPTGENKHCIAVDEARSLSNQNLRAGYGLDDEVFEEYFFNFGFSFGSGINGIMFAEPHVPFSDPDYQKGLVPCDTQECQRNDFGCRCTQNLVLPFNKTIQFVFTNYYPVTEGKETVIGHHSIHMHGHNFAVLKTDFPNFNSTNGRALGENPAVHCENLFCRHPRWSGGQPTLNFDRPPIRDTVNVPAHGYTVIRFRSTNPGHWLLHCHMENHAIGGMSLVISEAQELIPSVPDNFPKCSSFEWSEAQFLDYITEQKHGTTPIPTESSTTPSVPAVTETKTDTIWRFSDDKVLLKKGELIGVIFGAVGLGFFLMFLPFVIIMGCKSQTGKLHV